MFKILLKHCSSIICLTILFSIFLVPSPAKAIPIDEVSQTYIFDDKNTALLKVSVYEEGSLFRYDYDLTNNGPSLTLSYISVGYGPELISIISVPGNNTVTNRLPRSPMQGALQINLDPILLEDDSLAFSITYNGFVDQQDITVRGTLNGSLNTQFETFSYEKNEPEPNPVPEPGTLLLLGVGILAVRIVSRKKPR